MLEFNTYSFLCDLLRGKLDKGGPVLSSTAEQTLLHPMGQTAETPLSKVLLSEEIALLGMGEFILL